MDANLREWNAMKKEKIEKLKASGFAVGDAANFLALSPQEAEQVDACKTREIAFGGAKNK